MEVLSLPKGKTRSPGPAQETFSSAGRWPVHCGQAMRLVVQPGLASAAHTGHAGLLQGPKVMRCGCGFQTDPPVRARNLS